MDSPGRGRLPSRSHQTQSQAPFRTILITVGSTLFPALTDTLLSQSLLDIFVELGVERLFVQLGKGNPPAKLPNHIGGWSSRGEEGSFRYHPPSSGGMLVVDWVRYTGEFKRVVDEADAVISHAGSILTALRANKPLLVVPNESLMDNHQGQLADALRKDGYLMVCGLTALKIALPNFISHAWVKERKSFPELDGSRFRNILDETAGFEL